MSVLISFASPKAREEFLRSCGAGTEANKSMYVSFLGEYVVLENASEGILHHLRHSPGVEIFEDMQLQPFDATA